MLTEEKLDEINVRLVHSIQKILRHLGQETGVPKSSVQTATKLLKLKPFKLTVVWRCQKYIWNNGHYF
jgi:hypothetical protein